MCRVAELNLHKRKPWIFYSLTFRGAYLGDHIQVAASAEFNLNYLHITFQYLPRLVNVNYRVFSPVDWVQLGTKIATIVTFSAGAVCCHTSQTLWETSSNPLRETTQKPQKKMLSTTSFFKKYNRKWSLPVVGFPFSHFRSRGTSL